MEITIWGCRGSLPTPGPHTTRYGGNTTCVEVRLADNTLIVLDAGSGIRNLGKKILTEEPDLSEMYLFMSHAHWDHLLGFPFFEPAYSKGLTIRLRGGPPAKTSMEGFLKRQMEAPYFPVPFDIMQAQFETTVGEPIIREISGASITPIRLSHPQGAYGFKITEDSKSFVFIPDNELDYHHEGGLPRQAYVDFCQGVDLLLHDAQYTDEEYLRSQTWGNSSISSAVQLARDADVRRLGLFHHDPEHSDDQIDALVTETQARIAADGSQLNCFGAAEGMTITL